MIDNQLNYDPLKIASGTHRHWPRACWKQTR